MDTATTTALLAALAAQGDAVAILDGGRVIAQTGPIAALAALADYTDIAPPLEVPPLGPIQALARDAADAPLLVETRDHRTFEVRAHTTTTTNDGSGSTSLTTVVARDVTEREALRQSAQRSDEILAVGSHELKGPLHVIGMSCHLLQARADRGEPIDRSTLDRLRRQVTRLDRLIHELLDASRLQEDQLVLDSEELDLVELLREAIATTTAPRQDDLSLALPPKATVRGDRQRLGAVCYQLIDNAMRFTPKGTPIRVSLEAEPTTWCLRIVDEGPGVPADVVRHLFQRQPRRESQGTRSSLRLGLFVAAAAVRLHQGTLEYDPGPTGGAAFTMRLPRA